MKLSRLLVIAGGLASAFGISGIYDIPGFFERAEASLSSPDTQRDCAEHFQGESPPYIPANMRVMSQQICYRSYALLHSGKSRTAIWASEYLTPESVRLARRTERTSEFFAEPALPPAHRSELDDYSRSGYDRGHLVPSGDMPSTLSQQESFTLANIIPQNPELNRGAWATIERDVRDAVTNFGPAYVVSGPIFVGSDIQALRGRVLIPTHVWKAVHIPRKGSVVILAENRDNASITRMSLEQFQRSYGIAPFPALSASEKASWLNL